MTPQGSGAEPGPPRQLGHYELRKELGRGAQGVVYLAEDVRLQRQVALKMLSSAGAMSPEMRARFQREAALTSRIEHAGICGIHEVGEVDGIPFIAMQFVRGTTLADLLTRAQGAEGKASMAESVSLTTTGKSELQDVMRLLERVARALHAAHEVGLVHRDIKPANIMVTPDGDPVVLDFGLARDVDADGAGLTQSGQIMGTPAYLAPEQIIAERGGVDRRTDVYALGVTLFECVTLHRPYEAQSFDQLFHKILAGNLSNVRKLNPRIPRDLRTVIEVAMDRDRARRYATAEDFAEDLRRVRSFEPIRARAAGPVVRAIKWSRRHPARATAVVGGAVAVLALVGTVFGMEWSRRNAVADNLEQASQQLAAADFAGASDSVARALEREPESLRARELRGEIAAAQQAAVKEAKRAEAMQAAAAARTDAAKALESYADLQREIDELRRSMTAQRPQVFDRFASAQLREAFAAQGNSLTSKEMESAKLLLDAEGALDRAARSEHEWGGPGRDTEAARADYFLRRWREATSRSKRAEAAAFRMAVEAHDPEGRHRGELDGRGTLQIDCDVAEVALHLFRYEGYETLRAGTAIPRLVPVPTAGIGRVREGGFANGFQPGDPCLVVTGVAPGSAAAAAGLHAGDLVISIDRQPCGTGLFLREAPAAPLAAAGVPPHARVVSLNGAAVEDGFDWRHLPPAEGGDRILFAGVGAEIPIAREAVALAFPSTLVKTRCASGLRLQCLKHGEPVELVVPPDTESGLAVESTAYPLLCCADNTLANGALSTVDPGSYLVVARAPDHETLRVPVVVDRGAAVHLPIQLPQTGSTPPGCVRVPPGRARLGGDTEAFQSQPLQEVEVPGFVIARLEVTNGEYFAFRNDPAVRLRLDPPDAPPEATPRCLPRDTGKVLATKQEDGTWSWSRQEATADTPVLGLSWQDVQEYLAWRNGRAEAAHEPWTYDLPTRAEWERAARGADDRPFPWGTRFDPSLTVCRFRKFDYLLDVPGGFERRDESPFGILDLGGSREEWTRDVARTAGAGQDRVRLYYKCGGNWGTGTEIAFRVASRKEASEVLAASAHGFRLVLRPR